MSNHAITAENILSSLPTVLLQDKCMNALGTAIAELLSDRTEEIDLVKIYPNIDKLPETLVDILASDLKVDWYAADFPIDVKRDQVKSSVSVHRTLGTKYAAEKAISDIFPNSCIQEWFEYNGEPYCFRVVIDITHSSSEGPVIALLKEDVESKLLVVQRCSAHLDNISYMIRTALKAHTHIESWDYHPPICGTVICGTYPPDHAEET